MLDSNVLDLVFSKIQFDEYLYEKEKTDLRKRTRKWNLLDYFVRNERYAVLLWQRSHSEKGLV